MAIMQIHVITKYSSILVQANIIIIKFVKSNRIIAIQIIWTTLFRNKNDW